MSQTDQRSSTVGMPTTADKDGRPTAELVHDLTELLPRLMREELTLAMAQMREKGKNAGEGAGLLTGAGVFAWYGAAALVAAAVLGLAHTLPAWLSALIVGVALLVLGGLLALAGRQRLSRAMPPAPQQSIDNVRADISTVKERATAKERARP